MLAREVGKDAFRFEAAFGPQWQLVWREIAAWLCFGLEEGGRRVTCGTRKLKILHLVMADKLQMQHAQECFNILKAAIFGSIPGQTRIFMIYRRLIYTNSQNGFTSPNEGCD